MTWWQATCHIDLVMVFVLVAQYALPFCLDLTLYILTSLSRVLSGRLQTTLVVQKAAAVYKNQRKCCCHALCCCNWDSAELRVKLVL